TDEIKESLRKEGIRHLRMRMAIAECTIAIRTMEKEEKPISEINKVFIRMMEESGLVWRKKRPPSQPFIRMRIEREAFILDDGMDHIARFGLPSVGLMTDVLDKIERDVCSTI